MSDSTSEANCHGKTQMGRRIRSQKGVYFDSMVCDSVVIYRQIYFNNRLAILVIELKYPRKSGNFRVKNISCENISC